MMDEPLEIAILAAAIVMLSVTFATFVMFLIAWLGGWQQLAQTYRSDWPADGTVYRFQTGQMRHGTNYGNCLTLTLAEEGLEVKVLPVFRPGHPRLLFPWDEITATRERNWLGMEYVTLRFEREPEIPMRLSGRAARDLEARIAAAG